MNIEQTREEKEKKVFHKLKNMRLHESMSFGLVAVIRVPFGWIYGAPSGKGTLSSVFVPEISWNEVSEKTDRLLELLEMINSNLSDMNPETRK